MNKYFLMIYFFKQCKVYKFKPKKKLNTLALNKLGILFSKNKTSLSLKEVEASRRIITRSLNRTCKVKINISKKIQITRKNLNMRMGKGKGKFFKDLHPIYWGEKILALSSPILRLSKKALLKASKKLSCKKYLWN